MISQGDKIDVSEFYLAPNEEYTIDLVASNGVGNGKFYVKAMQEYYRFILK